MKCLAAVHQQNPDADLRGCTCCWVLGIMLDMGLGKCCTWQEHCVLCLGAGRQVHPDAGLRHVCWGTA